MTISVVSTTTANSTSVTIPATTAGNCLVVCVMSQQTAAQASVSGITLGGSAGNFADLKDEHFSHTSISTTFWDTFVWADPNCAGGQTSVAISGSNIGVLGGGNGGGVVVFEISGLASSSVLDAFSIGAAFSSSWSSGTSGTTTQASEIAIGATSGANTITGPGAPWTNSAPTSTACLAGYNILSSTGSVTYSGTSVGSGYAAVVVTLKTPATSSVSPFTPKKTARGTPSAVRGTGKGAAGAKYVAFPSKFTPPRKPAKGTQAAARGRAESTAGKYTAPPPVIVSPFYLPVRPAKGATARRGSSIAHPGAPYVAFPSPFTPPKGPARGTAAATRGRGHGSPGAPFVLIRVSPFPQPHGAAQGRSATPRTGRGRGSPGARFVLIQTSPFTRPKGPARGRMAVRRGTWSAGSATGHGAPVTPRNLLVSIASAAGTDDYGNPILQGLFAGKGKIQGPQIIATGTGGEYFAYNGPPALGNLILSMAAQAGTDPYGNAYPQGLNVTVGAISGTTITGNDFIINDSGQFFYSGTPGSGNLVASVTNGAGTDQFGNSFLAGITAYAPFSGDYIQLDAASINFSNGTTISNYSQPDVAVLLGTLRVTSLVVNGTLLNIPLGQPSGPSSAPSSYNQSWGQNITGVLNDIIATLGSAGIW